MAALCCVAGCGGSPDHGFELHPVSGTVLRAGEPLPNAVVRFYAMDPVKRTSGAPIPKGTTDDQGRFQLRTFDPADGAQAGEYAVTLTAPESAEDKSGQIVERDTLRRVYADPNNPVATITIVPGGNDLPPITID